MDLKLYGLADLEDLGHDGCEIASFCRNPLHPGPCKGWKRTLRAVAPGVHKALEDDRIARVHKRRTERHEAHKAAGTTAPRVRKMAHERTPKVGPLDGDGDGKLREGEDGGKPKRVRKGDPPTRKPPVRSTRTTDDGKGDTVEKPDTPEVPKLKTAAQRDALRAVLAAGAGGYDNKRGYLTKKRRDQMLANGLVEQRDDGRLYVTDHGRAVHEASIPRRNGEEIGFDGKTATERAAGEEAAKGEERRRLAAEAKAQFQRGIPSVQERGAELLGSPGSQRLRDAMRKTAAGLSKDLGEGVNDFSGDVSPAARTWQDRSLVAEQLGSEWRQHRANASWLRSAAAADPDHAGEYGAMADAADAEALEVDKRWSAAIGEANAARDALAEAVIGRYQAKGRRKTAAGLKLPDATKDTDATSSATDVQKRDIDAEVASRDTALAQLVDDLTPAEQEQARKAGNAYTAAVVEDIKAQTERAASQYELSVANAYVSRARDVPSMLRDDPKYVKELEDARARQSIAARRDSAAQQRAEVTKANRRRAGDQFQRTGDALAAEQEMVRRERRLELGGADTMPA